MSKISKEVDYFSAQIVGHDASNKLEQAYLNGGLEQVGVIDAENYPHNIPDQTTCELLDELLLENKLSFRNVRYCFGNDGVSLTGPYKEYSFDGRKFVRVKVKNDNNSYLNVDECSWVEVQPIGEKTKTEGTTGKSR